MRGDRSRDDVIPLREATKVWFAISLQTFGGPAGQIAVMQHKLVDEKRWIGQRRFLHALSYCTLLPGPEAQQLAVYVGWLLNGIRGGLIAGTLFVLPGFVALLALTGIYLAAGDADVVEAVFSGLGPAVLAIVAHAVVRVGRRAFDHRALVGLAVAAFVALTVFAVPFPVVVLVAGVLGWLLGRWSRDVSGGELGSDSDGPPPLIPDHALHHERPGRWYVPRILGVSVLVWAVPVVPVLLVFGAGSSLLDVVNVSTTAALVTFGGAYAALSFLSHQAVSVHGWLAPGEMVRGLALAETTPGPLIMVFQFVAGVAGYRYPPGDLDPWAGMVLASVVSTLVLFVPSFMFVFAGAPYVERLRGNHGLSAALAGITAAVVGVIANLGWTFGIATLFDRARTELSGPLHLVMPELDSFKPGAAAVALLAGWLLFVREWSVLRVLGACALIGLAAAGISATVGS